MNESPDDLYAEFQRRSRDTEDRRLGRWRTLIGSEIASLLESPEASLIGVEMNKGLIKKVAIEILCYYWKIDSHHRLQDWYLHLVAEATTNSNDELVREAAIYAIGRALRGSGHSWWIARLAMMVNNQREPFIIQQAAYAALLGLCGRKVPVSVNISETETRRFRFPEDVDQQFLQQCLSTNNSTYSDEKVDDD